ncbi:MAG: hypothetical protein CBE00_09725 [Planctomycetaceae bacterium TMED240]|nr:hypothetical protein [Rhodopirellula sp.]OUX05669.1 MAG: hypothetical protein CBE00_09725 [Planctomycetaceae bacterium TMED240]
MDCGSKIRCAVDGPIRESVWLIWFWLETSLALHVWKLSTGIAGDGRSQLVVLAGSKDRMALKKIVSGI